MEESGALLNGRNETELERLDRNLTELLQEVRVVQTGVQVLFAFLLSAVFQNRFHTLTSFQRILYFVTLLAAGTAVMLLTAPTSHHRILFQRGDKEHLVRLANRLTVLGLIAMGIAMVGVLALVSDVMFSALAMIIVTVVAVSGCVTLWYIAPLTRRRRLDLRRRAARKRAAPRKRSAAA